jgi:hypothetical protein
VSRPGLDGKGGDGRARLPRLEVRDEEQRQTRGAGTRSRRRPQWNATRAVTVAATPEQIWPWLLQIGWGRAGWYGYDWTDNGFEPSAWQLLLEHQHLEVGKDFPMSPMKRMYCVAFEEPRWMLCRGSPEPVDLSPGETVDSSTREVAGPVARGVPVSRPVEGTPRLVAPEGRGCGTWSPSTRDTRVSSRACATSTGGPRR